MVFQKKQPIKEPEEQEEELKPLVKESQREERETKESLTLVVKDLPTEQVRTAIGKDERNYDFVTIEEALTEILANQREILKFVKS
jgi:hypothetical protein